LRHQEKTSSECQSEEKEPKSNQISLQVSHVSDASDLKVSSQADSANVTYMEFAQKRKRIDAETKE